MINYNSSQNSLQVLAGSLCKDTKTEINSKIYSDSYILKYLKKKSLCLSESQIESLANQFSCDISRMRSLIHTVIHSSNWI